jgi:hypothetical protein
VCAFFFCKIILLRSTHMNRSSTLFVIFNKDALKHVH